VENKPAIAAPSSPRHPDELATPKKLINLTPFPFLGQSRGQTFCTGRSSVSSARSLAKAEGQHFFAHRLTHDRILENNFFISIAEIGQPADGTIVIRCYDSLVKVIVRLFAQDGVACTITWLI
jgi:hypothetical protein